MGNFSDFFKEIASSNAGHFPISTSHFLCKISISPAPSQKSLTLTFFASSCTDLDE